MRKAARCRQAGNDVTSLIPQTSSPIRSQLESLVASGVNWQVHTEHNRLPVPGSARPAAVLVLFGALDDIDSVHHSSVVPSDLDLLFVERAATMTHHAGQIAFPGGRIDDDDTGPVTAALREAVEETGLNPAGVDVVGTLADLPLAISRHSVTPVVAWWTRPSAVHAVDAAESAHVFRAPVADLLHPANRCTATVTRGDYTMRSPGFLVHNRLIWGFTGIVLAALFDELGWAEPWDRTHEREVPL